MPTPLLKALRLIAFVFDLADEWVPYASAALCWLPCASAPISWDSQRHSAIRRTRLGTVASTGAGGRSAGPARWRSTSTPMLPGAARPGGKSTGIQSPRAVMRMR